MHAAGKPTRVATSRRIPCRTWCEAASLIQGYSPAAQKLVSNGDEQKIPCQKKRSTEIGVEGAPGALQKEQNVL